MLTLNWSFLVKMWQMVSEFYLGTAGVITSPRSGGIRHAPGANRCRGFEVAKSARGHVASSWVLWKDVGGLRHVLCPCAAIPRPPVGFAAGLRGQVLGDVFGWVRGGGARGWSKVKVERCKLRTASEMSTWSSGRKCWLKEGQHDGILKMNTS